MKDFAPSVFVGAISWVLKLDLYRQKGRGVDMYLFVTAIWILL